MKKRFLGWFLAMILVLTCLAPAGALAETLKATVKMPNAGGSLHVRSWPSKSSTSVGYVQDGESITVYTDDCAADSDGELWTKIKVARTGKVGYIKNKYISLGGSSSGSSTAGDSVYIGKSGDRMNVRSGPGTSFSVAGYVNHGDAITVLERGATWSKIKVARTGVTGYIKTKYIKGSSTASSGGISSGSLSAKLPSSYDAAAVMTRTAAGAVNLRSGAGTGYASVAKLSRGDKLAVTGKSGDWYKVCTFSGKTGYIRKDYVAFGVSGKTTGSVNFRRGAGTGYGVIRQLSKGTAVTVNSVDGKWAHVTVNGVKGYIHTSYLTF